MQDSVHARAGITKADAAFKPKIDTNKFRRKRFKNFKDLLERVAAGRSKIRILDIGGTKGYWEGLKDVWGDYDLDITLLNLGAQPSVDPPFTIIGGSGCDVPFDDNSFDIVHSNSVIEHVGRWEQIADMASEIARLAPHYYVQTPNFWFPFEPHFRSIGFHWLPEPLRARKMMRRRMGHRRREASFHDAMVQVQSVYLLTEGQMRELFPDAFIVRERFVGFTKSITAIR